jgi:hypothetical protein
VVFKGMVEEVIIGGEEAQGIAFGTNSIEGSRLCARLKRRWWARGPRPQR